MGKFFYVDLPTLYEIEKLLVDRDSTKVIVLNHGNGFADVVRYNSKYKTAVFITVKDDDSKRPLSV